MATFQQSLERALEIAVANASSVLQFLRNNGDLTQKHHIDPLREAPSDIRLCRSHLAEGAANLLQLATTPEEYLDHLSNNYQELTCVRWLVNLDILRHLPESGEPIHYDSLARVAGVPERQLKTVSRMAVINGFLSEPQANCVCHGRASSLLVRDDNFMSWARWMVNYSIPVALKLADATKKWGETDAKDQTAFQLAMDTTDPFFDHIRKSPELTTIFSGYMRNVTASWPWSLEHAVNGFDWQALPQGATVVDVGGSHGQLAVSVARKFCHLNFVVQDLPETVVSAETAFQNDQTIEPWVKSRIRFMEYDFFQPQLVTDANVYFLRMIIHDWPDKDALVILQNLRSAMQCSPSAQIIIMDTVLPPPGTASVLHEQQLRVRDLMMMSVFNAKERELESWHELISSAGMEIAAVHQPRDSVMGLITVQLPAKMRLGESDIRQLAPCDDEKKNGNANGTLDARPPVLIIGAGIGGLCLAQALHKARVPFLIFERDEAIDARPQGYRLKLETNGAQALRECLSADAYELFESSCAITSIGETDLDPFTAAVIKSRAGGGLSGKLGLTPTFTVDRRAFRASLIIGLEDHVVFGKELLSYTEEPESRVVIAHFKDGSAVNGCFLVGADGLNSAVRRQHIPSHAIVDTDAVCVYGKTPLTEELNARFPPKGLRWMTVVSDTAPMLQSCLIGDTPVTLLVEPIRFPSEARARNNGLLPPDYVYWALIGPKQRFGILTDLGSQPTGDAKIKSERSNSSAVVGRYWPYETAQLSRSVTQEWHPSIQSLFELQDDTQTTAVRVASALPRIDEWKSSALVTMLGDAVHPMSPCGGVGANTALGDAAALARILIKNLQDCERKLIDVADISEFEKDMRIRAFKSIKRSEVGSKKMFGQKDLVDCSSWAA